MARTVLFLGILTAAAVVPIFVSKAKKVPAVKPIANQQVASDTKFRLGNLIGLNRKEPSTTTKKPTTPAVDSETWFTSETRPQRKRTVRRDPQLVALLKSPKRPVDVGPTITPIPEALRFDITPSFVSQRWSRVSNQLADLDWYGMRVPLVTGTQMQDLHGSISYFFDRNHRLQRIKLRGFTADSEPLVQFLISTYGLREYAAAEGRVYLAYQQDRPLSYMHIRNAGVLSSENRRTQQQVTVEINAPSKAASLSRESLRAIKQQREFAAS